MKLKSLQRLSLFILTLLAAGTTSRVATQAPPDHPHPHPHDGPPVLLHSLGHLLNTAHPPAKSSPAQTPGPAIFDATQLGQPLVLDKGWRVAVTSDRTASSTDFDDSGWPVRTAAPSLPDLPEEEGGNKAQKPGPGVTIDSNDDDNQPQGKDSKPHVHINVDDSSRNDFAWFRLHIALAPGHGPLVMLVEVPVPPIASMTTDPDDTALFVNGREVHPDGPIHAAPERYFTTTHLYKLDTDPDASNLTLAVRVPHVSFGARSETNFFATHTISIGHAKDLQKSVELWQHGALFERLPNLANCVFLFVLSFFLFALYATQRGHREYLWLALFYLVLAPINFIDLAARTGSLEIVLNEALSVLLGTIAAYFYFEFLADILDLRRRWARKRKRWILILLRWATPVVACLGPCLYFANQLKSLGAAGVLVVIVMVGAVLVGVVWFFVWLLFCVSTLIAATLRRNFEAGMLLIPLVLQLVAVLDNLIGAGAAMVTEHPYRSPLTFRAGPIPFYFDTISSFIGMIAIVLIIFMRFQRIHRDQERASSELAAARSVQELMIPQEQVQTPGFEVESVYNPAAEVGGDFFHVENTPDGGLLVVIGDVAGKGLKAAMNVSMLMGALRSVDKHSPARILEALNKATVGSESFTTCQAARFGPNGELVIANAGHLPPYINSQEITLAGGLPLGVLASVSYDETRLYLHPGDRVLFLSDGVVEARQPSGELFGFDRVHNLSNQSAFYIADAAKEFGQEDDITVVTVRRLAPIAAAAA